MIDDTSDSDLGPAGRGVDSESDSSLGPAGGSDSGSDSSLGPAGHGSLGPATHTLRARHVAPSARSRGVAATGLERIATVTTQLVPLCMAPPSTAMLKDALIPFLRPATVTDLQIVQALSKDRPVKYQITVSDIERLRASVAGHIARPIGTLAADALITHIPYDKLGGLLDMQATTQDRLCRLLFNSWASHLEQLIMEGQLELLAATEAIAND